MKYWLGLTMLLLSLTAEHNTARGEEPRERSTFTKAGAVDPRIEAAESLEAKASAIDKATPKGRTSLEAAELRETAKALRSAVERGDPLRTVEVSEAEKDGYKVVPIDGDETHRYGYGGRGGYFGIAVRSGGYGGGGVAIAFGRGGYGGWGGYRGWGGGYYGPPGGNVFRPYPSYGYYGPPIYNRGYYGGGYYGGGYYGRGGAIWIGY